jgi:alpha-L-arabinofuranosidase
MPWLSADRMAAENTFEHPENVTPTESAVGVEDAAVAVPLPPYSLTRLTVPVETP